MKVLLFLLSLVLLLGPCETLLIPFPFHDVRTNLISFNISPLNAALSIIISITFSDALTEMSFMTQMSSRNSVCNSQ